VTAEVIYDDDNMQVLAKERPGNTIVVSFGSVSQRPNGKSFWGDSVFERHKISAIGFMGRSANWYPEPSVLAASPVIRQIIEKYQNVITYGSSMGAYGALKHAAAVGATHSLAFAPQLSINPSELAFETRFSGSYNPENHSTMIVKKTDLAPKIYAFFDPYHAIDTQHVKLLREMAPSANLIECQRTGHTAVVAFAGSDKTARLISLCLKDDVAAIRLDARTFSRECHIRPLEIVDALIPKRLALSEKVFVKHIHRFDEQTIATYWNKFAEAHLRMNDLQFALDAIAKALAVDCGVKRPEYLSRKMMIEERLAALATAV
jgi:hypothetical protein